LRKYPSTHSASKTPFGKVFGKVCHARLNQRAEMLLRQVSIEHRRSQVRVRAEKPDGSRRDPGEGDIPSGVRGDFFVQSVDFKLLDP
jgi:hypothetical protein